VSAQARDYPHTDSHRPTRNNRVSRRNPCAWCGDSKYCLRFDNGDSACRTVGEHDQWTDAFMGVYLHRTDAGGDWRGPVRPLQSTRPGGGATTAAADLDTRDAIYSGMRQNSESRWSGAQSIGYPSPL